MKENKKIDLLFSRVYYATLIDENGEPKCLLGIYKKGVFTDIKTDEKYIVGEKQRQFYRNNIPVEIYHFLPFTSVVENISCTERITIGKILEEDKCITKTYDEKQKTFDYNNTLSMQETLAIIKPDGVKNATKIIEMIYKNGLKIKQYEVRMLDKEILSEHYAEHIDSEFYPGLEEYMLSGEVILMVLEGINAVEKFRKLMGPTDSKKAPKGTIRGEFGTDIRYNAVHGSDSNINASIEINRFFNQKQKRI